MKKVFESQIIDEHGVVKSIRTVKVYKNEETFGLHRTTEGIDWIFNFTGNELQMLIVLLNLENLKSGTVEVGKLKKDHLIKLFGFSKEMFNRILRNLEKKEAVIKLSPSEFILNPSYFYQGGTASWKDKNEYFNRCLQEKIT